MNERVPLVGQPIERVEDPKLLRGLGSFVDDVHRDGMLHAAILRSSVAHGVIRRIDVTAARAMPGVHAVYTAEDIGAVPRIPVRLFPNEAMEPFRQPVIADGKVRFVGEPMAIVIADTPALAEDALELIEADIDPLPAVTRFEDEVAHDALLFEAHGSNRVFDYEVSRGEIDDTFETAPYTRRERLYVHRHTGITMETRGVVSEWDAAAGRMTSWGATKVPFANRKILAGMLDLPEEQVVMIEGNAGGSFGVRGEFFPEDFLVPFAARKIGRPVKWIEDRREHLLAVTHSRDVAADLEIACNRDGRILAIRARMQMNIGAYFRTSTTIAPRNVGQFMPGAYRVPRYRADVAVIASNKSPAGTYRGPGRFESDFFRERMFDLTADDLGIDRVEFRRRNLLTPEELPLAFPAIAPNPVVTELDSGAYEKVLDLCLAKAGWADKQHLQGKLVDGRYHGLAVGCFVEGGAAGPRESARMVLESDGTISLYVGSSAVGQGVETILMQIAADAMDLPLKAIRVFHGSTTYVKEGWGSYHSRSTVMGGNAVLLAAAEIKAQLLTAGAGLLQCAEQEVSYQAGRVAAQHGGSVGLKELAAKGIAFEATFHNTKHTYTYGSHVAHVAVDAETGHIEIVDYVAIEDAGRIINPLTLHGQAIGSIVQGLGGTLLEHFVYDDEGQMLSGSLADYLVPLATDYPNIRSSSIEMCPSPNHPLGAKGAGEGGTIPVGGILANAVAAALRDFDVQPKALPLSPDRIWRLVQAAAARPA
ncbi:Carbon-monoxide dehydrogenase [Rhodopseudomonas palustris HaA2]|uniref:Carbon-monoxide dehydrogenase n=1 Tax=Rhodopseudomonas palustris (strain HaA2) TaxID=316058 RepID=Q2IVF1_RHOP2|nr:xanthine dehydrogenase family protein molybdopterin-binding subunit [Rhodopseudomonas palustris]ABD07809.1 Carbon-monoxide dehydrogenase [Rhodopseudomonas palustris HaA2]